MDDIQVEALAEDGTDPRCLLTARRSGEPVGGLRGVFHRPKLFVVEDLTVPFAADFDAVSRALCAFLAPSFLDEAVEVFSLDEPRCAANNAALEQAGFVLDRSKAFVTRALDGTLRPGAFTWRSLADVGRETFVALLAECAVGDPFEDVKDSDAEFQALVDYAGAKFDPEGWKIAYADGEPAGVVLPQAYADSDDTGSLFYVGVRPAFRGLGHGRRLHAAGLAFLEGLGLSRYVGSTDTRNVAMLRVFVANGCEQTRTQLFYRASGNRFP